MNIYIYNIYIYIYIYTCIYFTLVFNFYFTSQPPRYDSLFLPGDSKLLRWFCVNVYYKKKEKEIDKFMREKTINSINANNIQ